MEGKLEGHWQEAEEKARKRKRKENGKKIERTWKGKGKFVPGSSGLTADKVCMKSITEPAPFHLLSIAFPFIFPFCFHAIFHFQLCHLSFKVSGSSRN